MNLELSKVSTLKYNVLYELENNHKLLTTEQDKI